MKKPTKMERAAIAAARSKAREETHAALMRWGAKHEPDALGYKYKLDTPHGALFVSCDTDTILGKPKQHITEALWIFTRWEDVERAKAANVYGAGASLNPFSGKWNFFSHTAFLDAMERIMIATEGETR